jgi:hypothetical protein
MPIRLPSLLNSERVVVWAAEIVRGLETTLGLFDRTKQTKGAIGQYAPYTVATLPSPVPPWQYLIVTDDGAHASVCYSDGSVWKRASDNTTIP